MINLYIGDFDYDSNYRPFLVDILKPFFPKTNLEKYHLTHIDLEIIHNKYESDFFLLPFCWNYYIKTDTISVADKLIEEARKNGKKILIWVTGDDYFSLPQFDNVIGLYTSPYQSRQNVITIPLPVIIQDPHSYLEIDTINTRDFNVVPSVGFCGQSDSNLFVSFIKMTKLAFQNLCYHLNLIKFYSGPLIPPTYLRKKILNILNRKSNLNTNFILRDRYQGGESKKKDTFQIMRKEFYQNIYHSDYTLCVRGTGNFSARFYETLALGRIPVFINTDCILPFEDEINWKEHVVWVEENELTDIGIKISDFHNSLDKVNFKQLQLKNRLLWEKYFSFPGFINKLVLHLNKKLNS